jgi:serine/threonine-protein kinase RIO1
MADNSQMTDNMGGNNPVAVQTVAPVVDRSKEELMKIYNNVMDLIVRHYNKNTVKNLMVDDGTGTQMMISNITGRCAQLVSKLSNANYISPFQTQINYFYKALSNAADAIKSYSPQQAGRRRTKRSQSKRRRQSKRRGQSRRRRGSRRTRK